jgi:hypothetical protein
LRARGATAPGDGRRDIAQAATLASIVGMTVADMVS